jgi:uncharacterized protein YcfL
MKKIFVILTIAFVFIACNSSSEETTTTTTDSVQAAESPLMDAVSTAGSASKIIQDSTGRIMDTLLKK